MFVKLGIGFLTMAACLVLHALAILLVLRRFARVGAGGSSAFFRDLGWLILLSGGLVIAHLVEISLWAALYAWGHAMPDLRSALYFSAVTYTTVGYGDLVLPVEWRLVGGIEALTGILMCGGSTAFFFALVNQIFVRNVSAAASVPRQEGS